MKYKLMRRSYIDQIDDVQFTPSVRNLRGTWTVMAESNDYSTLYRVMIHLFPRDDFKIVDCGGHKV